MEKIDLYAQEFLIAKSKEMGRKQLAERLGVSLRYVDYMIAGKRAISKKIGIQLTKIFGISYAEFLEEGEKLYQQKNAQNPQDDFLYAAELARFGEHTDERANAIRLLACRELGLEGGVMDYTLTALGHSDPDLQRYLNREIETDKEYFDLCRNKMENKLRWLENEIEKMKKMRALFEKDEKT